MVLCWIWIDIFEGDLYLESKVILYLLQITYYYANL